MISGYGLGIWRVEMAGLIDVDTYEQTTHHQPLGFHIHRTIETMGFRV